MKNLIVKIATYVFLVGLIFSGMGIWEIIKERNVSTTPVKLTSGSIMESTTELTYAIIEGGRLDIMNTYEFTLSTKKSDIKLSSDYYIPVVSIEKSSAIYILKSDLEPKIEDFVKIAEYAGLLQPKDELPEEILAAFEMLFPGQEYYYLDSTYKPETIIGKLKGNLFFFFMLFGGLIIRMLLTRTPKENNASNPDKNA